MRGAHYFDFALSSRAGCLRLPGFDGRATLAVPAAQSRRTKHGLQLHRCVRDHPAGLRRLDLPPHPRGFSENPSAQGYKARSAALTQLLVQAETSNRALCDVPADGRVLAADGPVRYVEASVGVGARLTLRLPAGQNPSQVRGACSSSHPFRDAVLTGPVPRERSCVPRNSSPPSCRYGWHIG